MQVSLDLKSIVGDIFHTEQKEKEEKEKQSAELLQKIGSIYGVKEDLSKNSYNPYLKKDGKLLNPYIDYQKLLDNPNITTKAKDYITQATGLTATPVKETTNSSQQNSSGYTSSQNNSGKYKVGTISAKYEAGGFNGGIVSPGTDYGGVSYGIPQFSSKAGTADNFVNWLKQNNPEIGNYFGNYKAGSAEFTNAWKKAYADYGDTFSEIQMSYAYDTIALPLAKLAQEKFDIDYTRSPALQELVYTTALQFGPGSLGLSALGNVTADMSDVDIINASFDKKIANYKSYFKSSSAQIQEAARVRFGNERNDILALANGQYGNYSNGSGNFVDLVGQRIANTANYNNSAAKGQCVWYVRGRASEKLGKDTGAIGNANEMWYNAKNEAKLSATANNIKPNSIISYKYGSGSLGQKYGHVIFIEDVVGDTVYYTEGGSGYYQNGTDGVVKTATREQILQGVNSSGSRIGSEAIGIIDLSKY